MLDMNKYLIYILDHKSIKALAHILTILEAKHLKT